MKLILQIQYLWYKLTLKRNIKIQLYILDKNNTISSDAINLKLQALPTTNSYLRGSHDYPEYSGNKYQVIEVNQFFNGYITVIVKPIT